jgi:hypothetical protein
VENLSCLLEQRLHSVRNLSAPRRALCLTCQARRELEEPMRGVENIATPRHSDFEDDFVEAGLGQPSCDDDDEDTYESTCTLMEL